MLNYSSHRKGIASCFFVLISGLLVSQTTMLQDFKSLPAFPVTASDAFTKSKIIANDGHYTYDRSSDAIYNYEQKLQNEVKPYTAIIEAKGKAGIPTGKAVANDFSDLSSPETQAKLAKMTQEEKIKFAMEIQQRMKTNKNVQSANEQIKLGPLTNLVLKLNASCTALFSTLAPYPPTTAKIRYDKCDFHCGENDQACGNRANACNKKETIDFYTTEVARYNAFIKTIPPAFNSKKDAFEKDLKEFDDQAAKYKKEDIAVECSNVLAMLTRFAVAVEAYEKQGATLLIEAKNDAFSAKSF